MGDNSKWCFGDTFDKICYDEEANQINRSSSLLWNAEDGGQRTRSFHEKKIELKKERNTHRDATKHGGSSSVRSHRSKNKKETDTDTDGSLYGSATNIKAKVFMISGCEDSQTSADVSNVSQFSLPDPNGKAGGACTSALLQVLYANAGTSSSVTFVEVLKGMRRVLRSGKYSQIPQLTSSHPLDMSQKFYIVPPDCQGTRRAVLIGINYIGQKGELSGCHNDCLNMKEYIMNVWGFTEDNIAILMDDGYHSKPTRSNILKAYKSLASVSKSGDAVFCHYSGHGGYVRDDDLNEEKDGYDETLVPVDYASAGQIRDDDIYSTLVCKLPKGVTMVSVMDSCHSATVLDLPYTYKGTGGWSGVTVSTPSGANNNGGFGGKVTLPRVLLLLALIFLFFTIAVAIQHFMSK